MAIVLAPRRALDTTGVLGRTGNLSRAALVVMSLQELAYQLLAPPVQFPFEFALAHLPGFVGGEEGFGIREDSIGRCARGRAREIDARDAGSRLWHVESTFLESCRQSHHRSVPLPMEPYQNAARMSRRERARGGQTDGIRYRFEGSAGRRKDAGTRWLGCCPPEMSTGETHPRAKRPMNRAKTPLRRRAAPIVWSHSREMRLVPALRVGARQRLSRRSPSLLHRYRELSRSSRPAARIALEARMRIWSDKPSRPPREKRKGSGDHKAEGSR